MDQNAFAHKEMLLFLLFSYFLVSILASGVRLVQTHQSNSQSQAQFNPLLLYVLMLKSLSCFLINRSGPQKLMSYLKVDPHISTVLV